MKEESGIYMMVVYDHPNDFPLEYVARRYRIRAGQVSAQEDVLRDTDLERLRERIRAEGFNTRIERYPNDDPVIVESWI